MNTVSNLNAQQSAAEARANLIAAASGEGTIAAIAAAVVVRRNETAFLAKSSLKALAEALAEASQGRAKAKTFQNYLSLAAQVSSHKDFTTIAYDQPAEALAEAMKAKAIAEGYGFGIAEVSAMLNGEASPIAAKAEAAKAAKAAKAEAAKAEAEKAAKDPLSYAEEKAKAAIIPLAKAILGLLQGGEMALGHAEDLVKAAAKVAIAEAAKGSSASAKAAAATLRKIHAGLYFAAAEAEAADTAKAEAKAAAAKAAKAAKAAAAEAEAAAAEAAAEAEAKAAEAAEAAEAADGIIAEAAKAKAAKATKAAAEALRRIAEAAKAEAEAAKAKAKAKAEWSAKAAEAAAEAAAKAA